MKSMVCEHFETCELKVSRWVYEEGCLKRGVAFSHCPRSYIGRKFWNTPREWKELEVS